MVGNATMAINKTDEYVDHYLYHRKHHFNILITQFTGILVFKALVVAGLLVIGTYLVVDRQITLGQFVASEIVIITVVSAVEKVILSLEVIYDALVAVDKLGHVTDLPLEHGQGIELPANNTDPLLSIKNLSFSYDHHHNALDHISLEVKTGEHVAVSGSTGSGKHTLVKILLGLYQDYHGEVLVNRVSLRDANLASWRTHIGENVVNNELFEGSIFENIAMGRPGVTAYQVSEILHDLGLDSIINKLPQGMHTQLTIGTPLLHNSALYAITLARTLISKPRLVILDDEIQKLGRGEKLRILSYLQRAGQPWAVIYLTNDPIIAACCQKSLKLVRGHQALSH
jgi:ABC-type bacteriocin/lantibiotic exporter with double-glycine peptidase domain